MINSGVQRLHSKPSDPRAQGGAVFLTAEDDAGADGLPAAAADGAAGGGRALVIGADLAVPPPGSSPLASVRTHHTHAAGKLSLFLPAPLAVQHNKQCEAAAAFTRVTAAR